MIQNQSNNLLFYNKSLILQSINLKKRLRNRNNLIDDILHYLLTDYWTWLNLDIFNLTIMSKVFQIIPKRTKRVNGTVLTPEMMVTVTT